MDERRERENHYKLFKLRMRASKKLAHILTAHFILFVLALIESNRRRRPVKFACKSPLRVLILYNKHTFSHIYFLYFCFVLYFFFFCSFSINAKRKSERMNTCLSIERKKLVCDRTNDEFMGVIVHIRSEVINLFEVYRTSK